MKKIHVLAFFFIAFILHNQSFGQTTITAQPETCDGINSYVIYLQSDPSSQYSNFGTATELIANAWTISGSPFFCRSYIDFAVLHQIPQNATISSATLYLYGPSSSSDVPQGSQGANACWISRVLAPWSKNTINWSNQPSITTTNQATIPASTSQWNYSPVINMTQLVQDLTNLPDTSRHGFSIRLQTESTYRCMLFYSSNATNAILRPKLVVTYSAPPCTVNNNKTRPFFSC